MSCCNSNNSGIKQGTTFHLSVEFTGCEDFDLDDVSKIEFIFKRRRSKDAETIKTAEYPSNCQRVQNKNIVLVPFAESETYDFPEGEMLYMDTRVYMDGANDNPMTNIVEIMMGDTLFNEVTDGG